MNLEEAIEHLQKRLAMLNMGQRLEWSLDDRSAASLVCMEVRPTPRAPDVAKCSVCGETVDPWCDNCQKCGARTPRG